MAADLKLRLRHWGCWVLATMVIASGAVRRAVRGVAGTNQITSVYFHNPSRELFERCVIWLKRQGFTFVSATQLEQMLRGEMPTPRLAAWISMDDGYAEWAETVAPVARRHGAPVTMFIPSGIVAGDGRFPWIHDPAYRSEDPVELPARRNPAGVREALTAAQVAELAALDEITIGAHTVSHAVLTLCSDAELGVEIRGCRQMLEQWTQSPVRTFAYPAGRQDARSRLALRAAGYSLAATTEPARCAVGADPLLVPRYCVPDGVTFAEAVCNMAGVWRPVVERCKLVLERGRRPAALRRNPA